MSEGLSSTEENDENIFKILIATDNHLGYCEKDIFRGDDSYITFEEILQHAEKNEVDFILLGGDLFHEANPTTNALNKCVKLLRMYTLGDKEINFEILSNQNINFYNSINKTVNYEDPNMNIGIPVFSIHGNHDDPSGFARMSSLDLLSSTGMINYFGKWVDLTKININPIMMQKGTTKLALYGLSYIHDTRLTRLFQDCKVTMSRPAEDADSWFNLLVLHQNRVDRGPKQFLPERILPDFLDFVLWGHEHDCRINPESNVEKDFFVVQPGSSVATSLAEGEAIEKHCGLLLIRGKEFNLKPIKLKTVRPFVFESINLVNHLDEIDKGNEDRETNVQNFIARKVDEMIEKAKEQLTDHPKQPKIPLIRLKITYSDENQMFNTIKFGQSYTNKVANPKDILIFRKLKKISKNDSINFDKNEFNKVFEQQKEEINDTNVEDIVNKYLEQVEESKQLKLFAPISITEMCRRLYMHDDDDAAEKIINFHKAKLCEHLNKHLPQEEDFAGEIENFKISKSIKLYEPMLEMLDKRGQKMPISSTKSSLDSDDDSIEPAVYKAPAPVKRGRQTKKSVDEDDDVIVTNPPANASTRGRGRGRGSRGGASKTASRSRATKPIKEELNISINNSSLTRTATKQLTIQSSLSQSQRKAKSKVVYNVESDSD